MTPDREDELNNAVEKAQAAWKTPPPARRPIAISFRTLQTRYLFLGFALSFAIPAAIVLAPNLGRVYVHVWKVALGLEPDCPQWPANDFTCAWPENHPAADKSGGRQR